MKNFKILFLAVVALLAFSCEDEVEAPGTNYVTFESTDYDFEVTPDGTTTRDIYVYSANFRGSERTFDVNVLTAESTADPSIYSVPATVTIPANSNVGTLSVTASDGDLDFSNAVTVVVELVAEDGLSVGEKMTINLLKECIYNKVFLNITFDDYPEEVYWVIEDSSMNVVASVPEGTYAGMSGSVVATLCLADGSYTFYILDGWGDGAGPVTLSSADGTTLFYTDGAYGGGTSGNFTL